MKIRGGVCAITGASSGLGAEMARQLARDGWKLGLTARRVDRLEQLADEIRRAGGTAEVAPADAADPDATRAAMAAIARRLGPIDLLIANAGVAAEHGTSFDAEVFETMVRVNLTGAAYAIEAVLPSMIERGRGQVVGVSSLAGSRGVPGSAGYSATKAGLSALLEGLRPELKRRGVVVTIVHPGFVRTEMTANQKNPQPLMMDAEPAVRIILRGIAAGNTRVDFPWPMVGLVRLARLLPDFLYDAAASRFLLGPR